MKNGISAVLIVKNEEALLKRCLDSLLGMDQVVVYDTGSTDGTLDIARSLSADVVKGVPETPFHFGRARNAALSHAKGRWVLSIDADEVLKEGSLAAIKNGIRSRLDVIGYDALHINRAFEGGSPMPSRKLRLFKAGQFIWQYRIHEQPIPKGQSGKIGFIPSFVIEHFPPEEKSDRRGQNLELLELCVLENPQYMQGWKQLGIEYVLREEWEKAIRPLEHYMKKPDAAPPHEDCAVRMFLGKCRARLGDMDKALKLFQEAHEKAHSRREPLYWAAIELIRAGDPWTALNWLEGALKVPPSRMPEFSLYSQEVQGNLVQETLDDWKQKLKEAEEAWKAGKRPVAEEMRK